MSMTRSSASISNLPMPAVVADQQGIDANPADAVFKAAWDIASACLNVAVKLRIPDLIAEGFTDLEDLALKAGAKEEPLFRILRVLEMNGIVARALIEVMC